MIITIRNLSSLVKKNKDKAKKIQSAISTGVQQGLRQYEDYVVSRMLSGRRGASGLRRRSGIAANSLNIKVRRKKNMTIGNLTVHKRAWYLKVHEHFRFSGHIYPKRKKFLVFKINNRFIKTKHVYIPKRINMLGKFETVGKRFVKDRVKKQLEVFGRQS